MAELDSRGMEYLKFCKEPLQIGCASGLPMPMTMGMVQRAPNDTKHGAGGCSTKESILVYVKYEIEDRRYLMLRYDQSGRWLVRVDFTPHARDPLTMNSTFYMPKLEVDVDSLH